MQGILKPALLCLAVGFVLARTASADSLTTNPGPSVTVGSAPVTDTATLAGATNPTGTITFQLTYGGSTVVDTETVSVNGNGTYGTPTGFIPTLAGSYAWSAVYSGDANNTSVGSALEPVSVNQASPSLVTVPTVTSLPGGFGISDSATLSGGFNPTGTITFSLFGASNIVPLFTDTEPINNGTATTVPFQTNPAPGTTFSWVATYNGDSNNSPFIAGAEQFQVSPVPEPSSLLLLGSGLLGIAGAIRRRRLA